LHRYLKGNARRGSASTESGDFDATRPHRAIGEDGLRSHDERAMERILVVEDDRDTAEALRMLLVQYGYYVVVAHTSQQGIEAARRVEPHIVLCDIGLPDFDGYVVGSVLRQSGTTRAARLIAVTGRGEQLDRLKSLAAGFDEHLVKPVDPRVLLRELHVLH
jgi:DNA-binding response OmpR family regulator